jgi:hypothetical protein
LADALSLPVLHRDRIKHAIAEAFESPLPVVLDTLVPASFAVFYAVMDDLLQSSGVVSETNFHRGVSEPYLLPYLQRAQPILIHCELGYDLSLARFRARFERGERHWAARDAVVLAQIAAGETPAAWAKAVPLDLPIPILKVDTTDGYRPGLDGILAFIRASCH